MIGLSDEQGSSVTKNDEKVILNLNLELPEPDFRGMGFFFTIDQFHYVLAIYSEYLKMSELFPEYVALVEKLEEKNTVLREQKRVCQGGLRAARIHVDYVNKLAGDVVLEYRRQRRKTIVTSVLIGGGGILVGIGAGLLLGFLL